MLSWQIFACTCNECTEWHQILADLLMLNGRPLDSTDCNRRTMHCGPVGHIERPNPVRLKSSLINNHLIKLNNYVVQLIEFTSVLARLGSRKIFSLLNDSSHEPHFSACQNIETLDGTQKISNFSLYWFFRYSTPNMALQKIILTSFFLFFVSLLPDRGLCVLPGITSRRY
jgi:hypothetical protein